MREQISCQIIMITGQSSVDKCLEVIERGACDYIVKPINVADVLKSIEKAKRNIAERQEIVKKALMEDQKQRGQDSSQGA